MTFELNGKNSKASRKSTSKRLYTEKQKNKC